jgi:hypothetical protein|tara:strand:+ start:123 stop:665 length:543 start_codon:yes stop_codon:yes gene_type:complete
VGIIILHFEINEKCNILQHPIAEQNETLQRRTNMFEKDENIEKLMNKYAEDMSGMCSIMANVIAVAFGEDMEAETDVSKKKAKLLCLVHKSFLEIIQVGKSAKNGNVKASETLSNIVNSLAMDCGFLDEKFGLVFTHEKCGKNTFKSNLKVVEKKKEREDEVDIDKMIKDAGIKRGGAQA